MSTHILHPLLVLLLVASLGFASVAHAQSTGQTEGGGSGSTGQTQGQSGSILQNPLGEGATLNSFLLGILDVVVLLGSFVIVFMLVYVGFLFVAAQGEPGKIEEARKALLWTVIGALILLGAKAIAIGIDATVKALSSGS